jgi:hypothetical protein
VEISDETLRPWLCALCFSCNLQGLSCKKGLYCAPRCNINHFPFKKAKKKRNITQDHVDKVEATFGLAAMMGWTRTRWPSHQPRPDDRPACSSIKDSVCAHRSRPPCAPIALPVAANVTRQPPAMTDAMCGPALAHHRDSTPRSHLLLPSATVTYAPVANREPCATARHDRTCAHTLQVPAAHAPALA